jgi:hypothetical protein
LVALTITLNEKFLIPDKTFNFAGNKGTKRPHEKQLFIYLLTKTTPQ